MRNSVVSMRRRAIQGYLKRLCEEKYAEQRKFLGAIKRYINSRKSKQSAQTKKSGKKLEINILWSNPAERNQRICWDPMSPLCETIQFYRRLLKNSSEMETGKSLLFSKDCCLNKTNYGPLGILPSLSEVFKTLVDSKSALILKTFSTNMCLHIGNPMDLTPPPSASRSSRKRSWRITMLSPLH